MLTEDDKADMQKWMEAPLADVAKGCRYLRPFQRRKVQQLLTSLEAGVFKPSEAQDRQREMRQQVREWIVQFQERITQLQVRDGKHGRAGSTCLGTAGCCQQVQERITQPQVSQAGELLIAGCLCRQGRSSYESDNFTSASLASGETGIETIAWGTAVSGGGSSISQTPCVSLCLAHGAPGALQSRQVHLRAQTHDAPIPSSARHCLMPSCHFCFAESPSAQLRGHSEPTGV